jgi:putative transposase
MIVLVLGLWTFLRALVIGAAAVSLENVALRSQLAVLQRSVPRPKVCRWDRLVWVWLSRLWTGWRSTLVIVQPATVLAWHRRGFQLYWRWKSRRRPGGPPPSPRNFATSSAAWPARTPPGVGVGFKPNSASLAMKWPSSRSRGTCADDHRGPPPPWRAFLATHCNEIVAVDFFVVPTLTSRLLFAFVVLRHQRRELLHVNVTGHPTAAWAALQLVETFTEETAPKYLLRDRDAIYSDVFARRLTGMGIHEVLIAPRAPWQNPFAERLIGSIRRECLDHVIVFSERHLRRLLRSYLAYYNTTRPHQALHSDSPHSREVQPPAGRIVATPLVGGLHHRYQRVA